jgi:hypothetical protein
LLSAWGAGPSLIPPTLVDPISLGFQATSHLSVGYSTNSAGFVILNNPTLNISYPDSSIISWESWFIFNLRKINNNQYYESVSLDVNNCRAYYENTRY